MQNTTALFVPLLTLFVTGLSAQSNVGIGTPSPSNKLEVHGNLLVTAPSVSTNTAPTVAQTKTMINNSTITFEATDSTGRFYDTGGPAGDYDANIANAICRLNPGTNTGIELTVESMDLDLGDSLIIKTNMNGAVLLSVGNGYALTGTYIFNSDELHIRFKSDNNVTTVGNGFGMLFKRIYLEPNQPDIANFSGKTLFFETSTGALRSGEMSTAPRGINSTALGTNLTASGPYSTAFGYASVAEGQYSMALGVGVQAIGSFSMSLGYFTEANGSYSTSLGGSTEANGGYSTSLGLLTEANGYSSTSMGGSTEANGTYSTALGLRSKANGYVGTALGMYNNPIVSAQIFSDLSPTTPLFIIGNGDDEFTRSNAMVVRKDGHVGLGTNNPRVTLHIADGNDAGLADTAGFVLIGNANGLNILMDDNEIMARDNGAISDLYIQHNGGKVLIGTGGTGNLFDVNGTAGKSTGSMWSTLSDRRLKENIHPYSAGLKDVLNIKPVWYQYNALSGFDTKAQYVGVIAQELQEVAPYMVATTDKQYGDGTSGYLQVDASAMTYMLVNAVKELHAENITFRDKYEELLNAHASLEAEINSIKQLINAHSTAAQK